MDTVVLKDPEGIVFEAEVANGDGPRVQAKLDKLVRAYEHEADMTDERDVLLGQMYAMRGEVVVLRYVVEQQTEFLRTGCDVYPQCARDKATVFIGLGLRALATDVGKPEKKVVTAAREAEQECHKRYIQNGEKPLCGICLWGHCCLAVKEIEEGGAGWGSMTRP